MSNQILMSALEPSGDLKQDISLKVPSRLKRAVSSGGLDYNERGRKLLCFREKTVLEIENRLDDDVASDDDKNKIEMVEDETTGEHEMP